MNLRKLKDGGYAIIATNGRTVAVCKSKTMAVRVVVGLRLEKVYRKKAEGVSK